MNLDGASAIVTGAASGLGEGTARALAKQGATVVVADVNEDRGTHVAADIGGIFVRTDVTRAEDAIAVVDRASAAAPLRVVVNCAGGGIAARTIGRDGSYESAHDLDAFARVISLNLVGTFNMTRIAATAMSRLDQTESGGRGAIVNVGSVAAQDGQIGQVAYASAKAGIVGMTLPVARDLGPVGIRINTILPGLFDTPVYDLAPDPDALKAALSSDLVFPRRFGKPEEFASLVVELLGNDYINGETIRLDAGVRMPPKSG